MLFRSIDVQELISKVKTLKIYDFLIILTILIFQLLILSYRWMLLLNILKLQVGFMNLLKILWSGMFFNQIMPSSFGGDVFRVLIAMKNNISGSTITSSIIMERIIGLSMMSLLSVFPIFLINEKFSSGLKYIILVVPLLILLLNILLYFLNDAFKKILHFEVLKKIIFEIHNYWNNFFSNPKIFFKILFLTLIIHFCTFYIVYYLFRTFDYNINFLLIIYVMPIALIISSLPISVAGWGIRETVMVGSFLLFQIPSEISTAVGITFGIMLILFSLPGGFIFLFLKKSKSKMYNKTDGK